MGARLAAPAGAPKRANLAAAAARQPERRIDRKYSVAAALHSQLVHSRLVQPELERRTDRRRSPSTALQDRVRGTRTVFGIKLRPRIGPRAQELNRGRWRHACWRWR